MRKNTHRRVSLEQHNRALILEIKLKKFLQELNGPRLPSKFGRATVSPDIGGPRTQYQRQKKYYLLSMEQSREHSRAMLIQKKLEELNRISNSVDVEEPTLRPIDTKRLWREQNQKIWTLRPRKEAGSQSSRLNRKDFIRADIFNENINKLSQFATGGYPLDEQQLQKVNLKNIKHVHRRFDSLAKMFETVRQSENMKELVRYDNYPEDNTLGSYVYKLEKENIGRWEKPAGQSEGKAATQSSKRMSKRKKKRRVDRKEEQYKVRSRVGEDLLSSLKLMLNKVMHGVPIQ